MAPGPGTAARRAAHRSQPRPETGPARRPALSLLEPSPRRGRRAWRAGRGAKWLAGLLVVSSLFAVVVGDDLLTQGQIRLAHAESQVAAATAAEKADQVAVAQLAAPTRVVALAKSRLGMVAPGQVIDLPQVPLDVPLQAPQTDATKAPAPAGSTSAAR